MPKWLEIGSKIGIAVLTHASLIETAASAVGALKGSQKQDAVLALVQASLATAEEASGQDLLNDAQVQAATRQLIDAYVGVQNIVAAKKAAAAVPAAA